MHCADEVVKGWQTPVSLGQGDTTEIVLDQGPVIQTLPLQSVVCWPPDKSVLSGQIESVEVKGVAWSGGGRGICRVELSLDDGLHFTGADLQRFEDPSRPAPELGVGRNWGWVQFRKVLPLPEDIKEKLRRGEKVPLEICSKAIDGDFNQQPEKMRSTWNVLGICVNHWSRVHLTMDPTLTKSHVPVPPHASARLLQMAGTSENR